MTIEETETKQKRLSFLYSKMPSKYHELLEELVALEIEFERECNV
jgi:hypothetical protein